MFLGKQGEYIASVAESRAELEAVAKIAGFSEIVETNEPVEYIGGKYVMGKDNIINAQKDMRALAYQQEVDPITAHISRLKDEEQTKEIIAKIEELKAERTEKRNAIKERFPYYE